MEAAAVAVDWLAFLLEQRPAFFAHLTTFLELIPGAQQSMRHIREGLQSSLPSVAQQLVSDLAGGRLPASCTVMFKQMDHLPVKAATLLLALLRDLEGPLGAGCRTAVSAQRLRAAATAVERRGGGDAGEVARLLRQAAALL